MDVKQLTPVQISVHLQQMKGNTYSYANKQQTVTETGISTERKEFFINTDQGKYKKTFAQAATFLSFWHLVENQPVELKAQPVTADIPQPAITATADGNNDAPPPANTNTDVMVSAHVQKMDATADYLIGELKDVITKVKQDAGYIKQGQVINSSVNQILNVKKTQLEMYKAVSKK